MTAVALERLSRVGTSADTIVRAPGRANLIGEHTDYNEGYVLPVDLDFATYVAAHPTDGAIRLVSLDSPGEVVVDPVTGEGPAEGWGSYVSAVVRALLDEGLQPRPIAGVVASDVPMRAGLSSSGALEVAVALAGLDDSPDAKTLARACQRAENVYVGMHCGIMDQLSAAAGVEGCALLLDCRSLDFEAVRLPPGLRIVLIHSGIQRGLTDSAYNERRAQCEEAARVLGVPALRDSTPARLERARDDLDATLYRRARHVVTENERVLAAAQALRDGDLPALGRLFEASHDSLATDFEVSPRDIDALVEIAATTAGIHAARLTGAGFGGCVVALADRKRATEAAGEILDRYAAATSRRGQVWISGAAAGAL